MSAGFSDALTDYMDRPEELEKYKAICRANGFSVPEDGARGLCRAMAQGDEDVERAMWAIWNFENAFDDLIDQPGVNEDVKVLAMATLHDAIVESLDFGLRSAECGLEKHGKFGQVWGHLVSLTHWSRARRILAETARTKFFGNLRLNLFIQKNREQMQAMLVQTMLRCLSGDLMAVSEDPRKRAMAPAVRCGDVDLFHHMIYLARGFAAASTWCGKLGYDVEGIN